MFQRFRNEHIKLKAFGKVKIFEKICICNIFYKILIIIPLYYTYFRNKANRQK